MNKLVPMEITTSDGYGNDAPINPRQLHIKHSKSLQLTDSINIVLKKTQNPASYDTFSHHTPVLRDILIMLLLRAKGR